MIIIDRKKFQEQIIDQKLAYLLIRAIEHPYTSGDYGCRPSTEFKDLTEHLLNHQLASKVQSNSPVPAYFA